MTREPWNQAAEERGSFRRIPGADRRLSIVSSSFPIRAGSKIELQGSGQALQQIQELHPDQQSSTLREQPQPQCESPAINASTLPVAKLLTASRRGSMLGSLKAYYRKLRTFKGTVRALINLKRTPLSLLTGIKTTTPTISSVNEEQRSLQQHPHMIALTQRLWNCALKNEKKLHFSDYEKYMLCLHRLILPEFDIAASKELIMDDWKRDSGDQDYLDYAYFHLSMFELVGA
ncbi:unnamed protein product [Phytophthora fragariaefolia]|uniref:Unnamed protein product n=1 Tax=Phytophthora fragariaefolia TaxID=1490495 RepID=A0A9W6WUI4_9STRA|nr:unnamed protein product [Phytophthora fragariaefolia]